MQVKRPLIMHHNLRWDRLRIWLKPYTVYHTRCTHLDRSSDEKDLEKIQNGIKIATVNSQNSQKHSQQQRISNKENRHEADRTSQQQELQQIQERTIKYSLHRTGDSSEIMNFMKSTSGLLQVCKLVCSPRWSL